MADDLEPFGADHVFVPRPGTGPGSPSLRRIVRQHRRRAAAPSGRPARSARRSCVGNACGNDDDIRCGFSHVTVNNFFPCMATSLTALASDVAQMHALEMTPDRQDTWSRLSFVLFKNDRIFYLLALVTSVVVLATSLSLARARISGSEMSPVQATRVPSWAHGLP